MKNFFLPVENYKVPDTRNMEFIHKILKWYFSPTILGLENLTKDKPALYVSNHTLLGITDGPLYIPALYKEKDIYLRVLVDKLHKGIPVLRSMLNDYGAVIGSRENCKLLMQQKQHILVFPGGTNEVYKNKGEEYQLLWKERYGFAKLAIENEYPIIPVASLGGDDLYDIILDKEDIKDSKIGRWMEDSGILDKYFRGGDIIPPIVKGVGPTLIPKPQKIYYSFGKPISTSIFNKNSAPLNLRNLREKTEQAIIDGITNLRLKRANHLEENESSWKNFLNSF